MGRSTKSFEKRSRSGSKKRDVLKEPSASKSSDYGKIEKPQKKDDVQTKKKKYASEKSNKTSNDKIEKEVKDKKHQLEEWTASDYEDPERKAYFYEKYNSEKSNKTSEDSERKAHYLSESSSENSSSENSDVEDSDDDNNKNYSDVDMNDDDEFPQTQPLFTGEKRKVENDVKKNKKLKKQKNDLSPKFEKVLMSSNLQKLLIDWDNKCLTSTSNIDYKAWQLSHSARDVYFIAPDGYVYPNQSTMKKVSDAVKKKEIDEKTIASLVPPIKRVVAVNPRITFGITGLRYIGSGGGFGVQTIFYVAKEYMTEKDQTSGCLKLVKVQIPISALENFGRAVNSAIQIMEEVNPKKDIDE